MPRPCTARLAGPAAALALLAGCAPLHRTPLSDEHRKAIATSKAVGNISQQEIATSIESSGYGIATGGLLGAVVDTVVENNRASDAESGAAHSRGERSGHGRYSRFFVHARSGAAKPGAAHPYTNALDRCRREEMMSDKISFIVREIGY